MTSSGQTGEAKDLADADKDPKDAQQQAEGANAVDVAVGLVAGVVDVVGDGASQAGQAAQATTHQAAAATASARSAAAAAGRGATQGGSSASRGSASRGGRQPRRQAKQATIVHHGEATASSGLVSLHNGKSDSEEEEDDEEDSGGPPPAGVWGATRPPSPGMAQAVPPTAPLPLPPPSAASAAAVTGSGAVGGGGGDNLSEASSSVPPPPPRPKSRSEPAAAAKYNNLSYWRARRVTFYKNGEPFFPGVEFRFKPGRDVGTMEALLDKLSVRMDLPRGARYIFGMDGDRKLGLDELEDGASYVVSSYKTFKTASYGKKNGVWYASSAGAGGASGPAGLAGPSSGGWGRSQAPLSRKTSVLDADPLGPAGAKSSSGRVIRIIHGLDHNIQCRVLLNSRTSQPFEEVVEDLGQVLKINNAKKMLTVSGQEVRSFSQLRNEFADVDTFYLTTGAVREAVSGPSSPVRRSRSRAASTHAHPIVDERDDRNANRRRARSKSRPRVLYADPEPIRDYAVLDLMKEEPVRVTIRGLRRTFYPPMHHAPLDNSPPDKRLQLNWVFGYRGVDARRNLWVLPTGEVMYYVAAVAVLYDRDEDAQRHYVGHTEDIMCMDLHPSREMVASGQRAGRSRKTQAHIRIWSTETLLTLYVFGMGELDAGVSAVAFSQLNGGSYVLAVDAGRERILSVWQWQWGHLLGKVATLHDDVSGAAFHPLDDNLLITHGKGHLTFWTRRKDGFFERTDIIKPPSRTHVTALQFEQDGDVVTADADGFITVYSVDADGAYFVRLEFEAHNKGVSSLVMLSEGTLLSGGEKDRRIIAWDSLQNYKKITETKLAESAGGVRSLYPQRPGRNDGNIYVGTTRNNILEGSLQRRFNQVVFGHCRQLWGLAVHPDEEMFATGGHDKHVALWRRHKLVWVTQVPYDVVSLSFHPFGMALAVGSTEGHLIVLNADTSATVASVRVCGSPLSCLAYNPAGDLVAIGSQNGSVYLFRVSRDGYSYKRAHKIRGSQPLTQLDWSTDGGFLQTATEDYDLTFWDVKALSAEKSPVAMKDVKWYTQTCCVGYTVAGIWNNRYYPMTSLVVTANRSAAHDLLVSGDSDGYLRLFRYPCLSAKAEYNEEKVYSLQVASARFLFNDRLVATVGGTDATLMLWDVVDD